MKEKDSIQISFFVPCLNEELNIINTLKNIEFVVEKLELKSDVIIVDDNSNDKTIEKVEQFLLNSKLRITLIKNNKTKGLGINYVDAAFVAKGEYYILINGDNAEPKESIISILSLMGEADIIIPYFEGNDDRKTFRVLISKLFTFIINVLSSNNIPYYNGPVLHKRYNVMRWSPDTHGYAYQAELITRILCENATYKTVKIKNSNRNYGNSSAFTMKNFLSVNHSLLQIFLRRLRNFLFYSTNFFFAFFF